MPRALDHRYPAPLEEGVLVRRYKRFLADVRRRDGDVLTVHCANPGAMTTCKEPGSRVRILDTGRTDRKLPHNLEQVRSGQAWVAVNTAVPNRAVAAALARGGIAPLGGYERVRPEAVCEAGSRIDFLLEGSAGRCWVEVKNVTLRVGREACFPDAVTTRGLRHLEVLRRRVAAGERAVMLYLVSRADVDGFRPAREVDPGYAQGLAKAAEAGVEILPLRAHVGPHGVGVGLPLPYHLDHA